MTHDKLCYVAINGGNCCPWLPECDCQCMCEYIKEVRDDTLASLTGLEWYSKARWTGYYEGIDAAREAVATIGVRKDTSHDMRVQALAAIEALKEKP